MLLKKVYIGVTLHSRERKELEVGTRYRKKDGQEPECALRAGIIDSNRPVSEWPQKSTSFSITGFFCFVFFKLKRGKRDRSGFLKEAEGV